MELPIALKAAVEEQADGIAQKQLIRTAADISEKYRKESGRGERLVSKELEAIVYSIVRMPATFGAVTDVLQNVYTTTDFRPESVLDVGAGTGAASWGAALTGPVESITCIEREEAMLRVGKKMMQEGNDCLKRAVWLKKDAVREGIGEKADLVIASYTLNEMNETDRNRMLERLWLAAEGLLVLIEPGTPEGFRQLRLAREYLIGKGGHIAAPCPHEESCPVAENDWCHFTCRVARSRLHKVLKGGDAPYEDEKFSYLAVGKTQMDRAQARILRHPYIEKGQVTLELCTKEGLVKRVVRKREGELYKTARKSKCGDPWRLI